MTYITTRQRRLQRRRQQRIDTLAHVGKILAGILMFLVLTTMFSVAFIEWLAGCGEVFYYGDGTWKTGQCVFMDSLHPVREGVWK